MSDRTTAGADDAPDADGDADPDRGPEDAGEAVPTAGVNDPGPDADGDTDTARTMSDTNQSDGSTATSFASLDADRLRAVVDRVGLVALVLFALFAGLQFYGAASSAIGVWVSRPYEPLVRAAFNLALLLLALAGIGVQLRRLAAD